MKQLKTTIILVLIILLARTSDACRFWAATGIGIKDSVEEHLLEEPKSLKYLGEEYQDGWSVGYYANRTPVIYRSALASNIDTEYDEAIKDVSAQSFDIAFAHLRRASSGCVDGISNPHPFEVIRHGKTWLFGHNGGMNKQIMVDLIGEQYLAEHPPAVCTDNAPDSWIDSELYFIFLMKSIEENSWNVAGGIEQGLSAIYQVIPENKRYLNFFLTNGENVWVFRKGTSLFYRYNEKEMRSYVSSTIPHARQSEWQEFPENTIAVLSKNNRITFIPINDNVPVNENR